MKSIYSNGIFVGFLLVSLVKFNLAEARPFFFSQECNSFIEEIQQDYKFGWVTVPEDYSRVDGKKISVFWYTKIKAHQQPTIFFYGGPVWDDRYHYKVFSKLEDKYGVGIIYMDQRGMGCSDQPRPITDIETASEASLYSSDYMVRDAEEIRKELFGEASQWKLFGQSYGGYIIDRYVSMFPESIISAHNYGGGALPSFTDFFYNRLKSNHRVAQNFFQQYPDSRENLEKFKALFTSNVCITLPSNNQLCGFDLFNTISESYFIDLGSWRVLSQMIAQPFGDCENCVFISPEVLNEKFVSSYVNRNIWTLEFFFNRQKYARVHALWRQELNITDPNGLVEIDCYRAIARLENEGISESELPYNHCKKITLACNQEVKELFASFISKVPVRETLSLEKLTKRLTDFPHLKYYAYTGNFDSYDQNSKIYEKLSAISNVTFRKFENNNHFGYLNESDVWKDLSGKNIPLMNSSVQFSTDDRTTRFFEAMAAANGQIFSGMTIELDAVDLGLANQELTDEIKSKTLGKIALISRGINSFAEKVNFALQAGAKAVVIGNNQAFLDKPFVIGLDPNTTIPVVMISTGDYIKLTAHCTSTPKCKLKLAIE